MRAGVRPGLQILWVCLWWTGRFDSDTLPPMSSAFQSLRESPLRAAKMCAPDEPQKTSKKGTIPRMEGSQAPGAGANRNTAAHQARRNCARQTSEAQEAGIRRVGRKGVMPVGLCCAAEFWNPTSVNVLDLLLHVIHQQVLAKRVGSGEIGFAAADFRDLLHEIYKAIIGSKHEGVDQDAVPAAADHLMQSF